MDQVALDEFANDRRKPAGIIKILHQESAGRH